ncbi:hypothetical protein AVEN_85768-1, partial [Araneus ventricosus]
GAAALMDEPPRHSTDIDCIGILTLFAEERRFPSARKIKTLALNFKKIGAFKERADKWQRRGVPRLIPGETDLRHRCGVRRAF